MKKYLDQIYNEGFATIFYLKPLNYLKKRIKNEKSYLILSTIIKIIYTILVLTFAIYILIKKLPI